MSNLPISTAAAVSFLLTATLVVALRPLSLRAGLVDSPGGRKNHIGEVPLIGGIAMLLGIFGGMAALGLVNPVTVSVALSMFLLVLVGVIDDARGVMPLVRVLVQIVAVLITVRGTGLMLDSVGNPFGLGEIQLGPFALLGTLMVAITVINAFNLVDGVDGLAGILALVALSGVALVGGAEAMPVIMAVIVAGSIVGFLIFNFPMIANRPYRTFMGDAGSTVLGFVVFWAVLGISQGDTATISPVAGLWFASIPVYDSLTCFVRRIAKRKSPFRPGLDHFHHTLLRGGFLTRKKLYILGGLQAIYATVGAAGFLVGVPDAALFFAWCVLGLSQHSLIALIAARHRLYKFRQWQVSQAGADPQASPAP
jgi:UDP-GlcNAc:undecaprenyl-phosphate GlcNAc-1-phosphate transferase